MVLPYQLHQKLRQSTQKSQSSSSVLDILNDKPFWIWDKQEHLRLAKESNQQCCFNHIVQCPTKGGRECPLFDYEKLLYDTLMTIDGTFKDKHLFSLKSTGLGVSEFFLRLMACLAVKDNTYRNSQMVIITGPNLSLAVKLIQRLKNIFEPKFGIIFQNKETVLELNGCTMKHSQVII
jgi:hypothetical protein